MKVLVIGGGVIGVSTAYYLARAGHEVQLIERRDGPAHETSYANAGQISPGYAAPWAGPDTPMKALKWLLMRHGPLVIRPTPDPAMWAWLLRMLRNCTSARYIVNKARMTPLAEYSRDSLRALETETGVAYDGRRRGTLQLFRQQKQFDAIAHDVDVLNRLNIRFEILDRDGCVRAEPALSNTAAEIAGGLRLPDDDTGDCRLFTMNLAKQAEDLGVRQHYRTVFYAFATDGRSITGAQTSRGFYKADAFVLALGSYSAAAIEGLGFELPVYPVKGYSLTMPVADEAMAPVSTVMDETYKTAITRLGDRIRVGGTAELAGLDLRLPPARRAALEHSFNGLFPLGANTERATFWCGLRPMTPDGPPVIGETPVRRLYLNTGHGTLGWTMACGSARVLTDLIGGKIPDINISGLGLARFR